MKAKVKKPYSINLSHFSFKVTRREFLPAIWTKWLELRKKDKLDDLEKYWLKEFRKKVKNTEYYVKVTHKSSQISKKWILEDLNFKRVDYAKALLTIVNQQRQVRQKISGTPKEFAGAKFALVGGVFEKPNQINVIAQNTTYNDPMQSKRPRHKTRRYIGVELEFNPLVENDIGTSEIAKLLKTANLGKYCHVGTDGSCGINERQGGYEVRVLLTEDDWIEPLTKVMSTLTGAGFKVNHRCGTHVHLDMRNRDVKKCYNNFYYTQYFMRKLLVKSRKRNGYCKVNESADFDSQMRHERRRGINVQSYNEHGTLEIRMHHGTLTPSELIPWIKLLLKIANYDGKVSKKVMTLKQVNEQYQLEEPLQKELESRLGTLFGRVLNLGA